MIKRTISLQSIPFVFLPVTLLVIAFAIWSMVAHQKQMRQIVANRNRQEAALALLILEGHAETLKQLEGEARSSFLEHKFLSLSNENTEQAIILIDQNEEIIFATGNSHPADRLASHPGVAEALAGDTGSIEREFENETHLISYGQIESLGWGFVLEEVWRGDLWSRLNLTLLIPLIFIPLILLFFVYMWGANRWVYRPLLLLNQYAQKVGDGDLSEPTPAVSAIQEIDELQVEIRQMVTKLRESRSSLQGYAAAIRTAQEDERRRLSQDLHDDTIQSLVYLDQQIQLSNLYPDEIERLRGQVKQISSNLRSMIQGLRPSYLDELGLAVALETMAETLKSGQADLNIHFKIVGTPCRLHPDEELACYRIAQEGVSNSLKHALAKNLWISLEYHQELTRLEIRDDGKGIPAHILKKADRYFGMRGMYERALSIGGKLTLDSNSFGTTIDLKLPHV